MQILNSIQGQNRKSVITTQVSITKGITNWTTQLARKHVVNETIMRLCSIIINDHNKRNHLRTWGDAFWFYTWIEGVEGFQHCVCLAIIPMQREELLLQKP
jgi:hypothetical protein